MITLKMKDKFIHFLIMIIVLISFSCKNTNNKTSLPKPPEEEAKYAIKYKGKMYKFYNDIEHKKFCDSIGISLDSVNHIIE